MSEGRTESIQSKTAANKSARTLWLMVAIFAAPVVAAWFFYLNPQFLPSGRTNLGQLIEPIVPLPEEVALTTAAGEPFDRSALHGKWTLTYLVESDCGEGCMKRLLDLRQIRLALGQDSLSVERLAIVMTPGATETARRLESDFDGMHVVLTDAAGGVRLIDHLGEGAAGFGKVYILDPMGNLMMRYAADAPAKDTLKDMERLLKASKNWIKGAQYGHK